jgi:hypothetical protein
MMNLITKILFPLCLLLPITTVGETMDDVKKREGLYYKNFSDAPFTGNIPSNDLHLGIGWIQTNGSRMKPSSSQTNDLLVFD